jgi:hypothetical protein
VGASGCVCVRWGCAMVMGFCSFWRENEKPSVRRVERERSGLFCVA